MNIFNIFRHLNVECRNFSTCIELESALEQYLSKIGTFTDSLFCNRPTFTEYAFVAAIFSFYILNFFMNTETISNDFGYFGS